MSLKQRALKGVFWIFLSSGFDQVLKFGLRVLLARLLFPEDFGVIAVALFIISILTLFSDFGITTALIQRKDYSDASFNTGFVISLSIGAGLFLLAYAIAPSIGSFYGNALLSPMVRALAFALLFTPLGLIATALLDREFQYKKKFLPESVSSVVYAFVSVVFALKGFGAWSLVYGYLSSVIVNSLLMWKISKWKITFADYDRELGIELIRYGKHVLGASILALILFQADNTVVGKVLGFKELGFYAFAYSIANMTVTNFAYLVSRVSFSVFCKLQSSPEELKRAFIKTVDWLILLLLPLLTVIIVFSKEMVILIFTAKWLPIVNLMIVICIASIFRALQMTSGYLFQAVGKPHLCQNIVFLNVTILFSLIIPFSLKWNVLGASVCVLLAMMAGGALSVILAVKMLKASFKEFVVIIPAFLGALYMFFTGNVAKHYFFKNISMVNLIITAALSLLTYFGVIVLLRKNVVTEIKGLLISQAMQQ